MPSGAGFGRESPRALIRDGHIWIENKYVLLLCVLLQSYTRSFKYVVNKRQLLTL